MNPSSRANRILCVILLLVLSLPGAVAGTRVYKIGTSFPFPPWDVGPLEGVSPDVLRAICAANGPMECKLSVVPAQDCFDSDGDGNPFVGTALTTGRVDGCLSWFDTAERMRLGAEFGHGFSSGSTPQLIASDDNDEFDMLGGMGSLDQATVGFIAGFFSDPTCLGLRYSDFGEAFYGSDEAGKQAMVSALLDSEIDLAFWDSTATVPAGTHLVGEPLRDCGPDLGLVVYPPGVSRKDKSDGLRRDYNCGLALIRASGELEQICATSPYPGGDPACLLDGPPPTVQCLAENPSAP